MENEKAATIDIEEKRDFEKYCSMTKIQQSKKQITKRFAKNKLPIDLPYRPGRRCPRYCLNKDFNGQK